MKRQLFISCDALFVLILFCFAQCRKERVPSDNQHGLNIILHDQPLDTIRYYIQGMWKCHYAKRKKGSDTLYPIQYFASNYWKFVSNNRVRRFNEGLILADSTIKWHRDIDVYKSDSTFIMSFFDKSGDSESFAIDGFVNDTLVLHSNSFDASFFYFTKSDDQDKGLSITLYDKPLDFIQSHIQGNWKCHYGKGGIASNMVQSFDSFYWTFAFNSRIQQSYKGTIITDTTIKWSRTIGAWTFNDSTFIMSFYDKRGYNYNYVVNGFFNDTLILNETAFDAMFFYFTKL